LIDQHVQTLTERFIDGGGFMNNAGGAPRTDATCWSILALNCAGKYQELIQSARRYLAYTQVADGRVCITHEQPETCWPTSLAILAWQGAPDHQQSQETAVRFLLERSEVLTPKTWKDIVGYDTTLRGWSWTANTFSWVEPTALAIIALRVVHRQNHSRAQDAVAMLMDRQLPDGGWNVGSTIVFGQALRPMPENTGIALQALCGLVPRKDIEKSIRYLGSCLERLHTPFTLGWALLGLSAWVEGIPNRQQAIMNVLQRQAKYGPFDTTALSVLLVAHFCEHGLIDFFGNKR
jgi:hypothetical protein